MEKKTETTFAQVVRQVVARIPEGQVLSYREVALRAGFPGAARAVGSLMKSNYDPEIPCHRVIRSDGKLGQYNRGAEHKGVLLEAEGVIIRSGRVVAQAP